MMIRIRKLYPALIVPSPVLNTPHPQLKVPNNILRHPPFYAFALFSIVSFAPFIIKPDSAANLTIFIIISISLFKIINAVVSCAKFVRHEATIPGPREP